MGIIRKTLQVGSANITLLSSFWKKIAMQDWKHAPAPEFLVSLEDELERRMKEFMDDDHFSLFIQPVVELETGKIGGGEVLSRLNHPERGLVFPNDFIPIINRMGLQTDFDRYIFRKSCAWISRVQDFGIVSVNFSRKTLSVPGITRQLSEIADQYRVAHGDLAIEITEWEQENDERVYRTNLRELREAGFKVFLDDYGSGITCDADLYGSNLDIVKIDRSVLLAVENIPGSTVLRDLNQKAVELGLDAVCEGIETEEQEKLALEAGCRYGQGYRYFLPMNVDSLMEMIEKSRIVGENPWSD